MTADRAGGAGDRPADVLIVGATGFIGSRLARRLVAHGDRVRVLVRAGSDRSGLAGLPVEFVVGDLGDPAALRRAADGVHRVYNCAGLSADWAPRVEFRRVNVDGCRNLARAAGDAGTVRRLLHVSTTDVYGYPARPCDESAPPRDIGLPYSSSKARGELAVREEAAAAGLPLTVIRPVSVYGPGSKDFVVEIAGLLLRGQMVHISRGTAPAGLLYVDNAAEAMIAACESADTVGRAYNLRDTEETTWREYVAALARGLDVPQPRLSLPRPVAMGVACASEAVYGALRLTSRPLLTRHAVNLFNRDQSFPVGRAQADFGFKSTVTFEEGMRRTLDWLHSAEGRALLPRGRRDA
ncbi:NAD-dependent epimerase/dehydratase family protein [Streptomyces sp. MAR4 CNX-425]|uniref:NAD-dependent epimerase/dehydratase family protein n=1 Tax=Streptomyces sp. MAR4 CNX-425 TaxID=3406343 RepID=UPI003B504025